MVARLLRTLRRYLLVSAVILLAVLYALSTTWPDPEIWHTVELDEEFTADKVAQVVDFSGYLALEERLFVQLDDLVYNETPNGPDHRFERYSIGSIADPSGRNPNWNRSFERVPPSSHGAVLLLHGMSDSPYSLRALGQALYARGYRVLGLRLPGHGTAPSGLLEVHWQDMAAAVQLAMKHLEGLPTHIVGYSTGAPLALNYALDAEQDETLPSPASLVLLSPAIGVSPAAALATWKRRLSYLPGLDHLAWLDQMPEFDPYKYNSFATNAGEQVYLLTDAVGSRISARSESAPPLPPILILKSTVDATVSNEAVVDRLLIHLTAHRHEYVMFDINRRAANASLLVSDPGPLTRRMLEDPTLPFSLTVVGNLKPDSPAVLVREKTPFSTEVKSEQVLADVWPASVLSLSHIAVPFPPDDPLYGRDHPGKEGEIFLGHVNIQGERGLLRFSSDWLIRLRHNPFYDYLEERVIDWMDSAQADANN